MQFAHPYLLFFLVAVLLPLIIHLFNFRRYKVQYFSNTAFLQALQQHHKRESEIKKWIILGLRMLAIAALVIALAKPYIPVKNASSHNVARVMVYVDNSFSMENKSKYGNLLHEAKQQAKAIVDAYHDDMLFYLLTNDFNPEMQTAMSKAVIKEEIDKIQVCPASPLMSKVCQYAAQTLQADKYESVLYYISDFQLSAVDFEQVQAQAMAVNLVPLAAPKVKNICIDSLWMLTPDQAPGSSVSMGIKIHNYSDNTIEAVPVKLVLNNNQKAVAAITIDADNEVETILNFTLDNDTIQSGYVEITDYPITFDDRMYFSLQLSEAKHVLQLYIGQENRYVSMFFGSDSTVCYEACDVKNINYGTLQSQQLVLLETDNTLSPGLMKAINEYVCAGGNVLLFPKENMKEYNNELQRILGTTQLEKWDTTRLHADRLNMEHVIYKQVFEQYPENIDLPVIKGHYTTSRSIGGAKESIISMENGDDFLVAESKENGMVYTITSPLSTHVGNFVEHALFVPTLWNMSMPATGQVQLYYTIGHNEPICMPLNEVADDRYMPQIRSYADHTSFIPEVKYAPSSMRMWVYGQIQQAGIYAVECNDARLTDVAYNYNRLESPMEFADKGLIEENIEKYELSSWKILNLQHKNAAAVKAKISEEGTSLFVWFIILCLVCIGVESILLRRFFTAA